MKTITTGKRIRNTIRTEQHIVWFEPKTGTYEIAAQDSKRFTTTSAIKASYIVYPDAALEHQMEFMRIREEPIIDVDIDDPREAYVG